jgi:class 3 adenylate cyclase
MQCPRCQQDNPPHARFCLGCGACLTLACGSCGAELPGGARFCLQCGEAVAASSSAPARSSLPETYTPKHLAEKILSSKAALEGERKQVTVLFADLKGSMELLADRDPEEARKLLDPVLERMMEAVHRFEGTVNQVMGDGIMALFGAPVAHEDHAVRACYAALRMQESVVQYAEGVFRSHGVPIQIRVGLNSGDVVVRAIGSDLHMDYTAVGQTTHLAARMEQMATPGSILLAPATLQLAEGYVQVAPRGPVAVKGLPDPVEVYTLTRASAQRSRLHVAAARGLTRFVGRDAEIEQIRRALALAREGRGQVVAIVGEPGVGKSRLVYEFTHSHRTQDWLVLEAGALSYGKATSYLPVIDLLRAYFKIRERDLRATDSTRCVAPWSPGSTSAQAGCCAYEPRRPRNAHGCGRARRPRAAPPLLARQGRLYFLEGIEVFLQAADVLLHVRDGQAELACSSEGSGQAAGHLGKLGAGPRRIQRTANIPEREGSEQHPDHRDAGNPLVCHCRSSQAVLSRLAVVEFPEPRRLSRLIRDMRRRQGR